MKRALVLLVVVALVLGVMVLGAGAAFAGEITGQGQKILKIEDGKWDTGLHARSVCAFSGQQDEQFKMGGSKGDPAHSQSFGQRLKNAEADPKESNPGIACNPIRGGGGG